MSGIVPVSSSGISTLATHEGEAIMVQPVWGGA